MVGTIRWNYSCVSRIESSALCWKIHRQWPWRTGLHDIETISPQKDIHTHTFRNIYMTTMSTKYVVGKQPVHGQFSRHNVNQHIGIHPHDSKVKFIQMQTEIRLRSKWSRTKIECVPFLEIPILCWKFILIYYTENRAKSNT